jgi:MinD-like ATPase involved in chromosome partitioning or flagellar assembly
MRTITFFSYKGGAGRSLAVANAALYLAQLGFKVAVLDLDLEAPGLVYKFSKAEDGAPIDVNLGIVDYLFSVAIEGKRPSCFSDYAIVVPLSDDGKTNITLLPAGKAPSAVYWEKLCRLNWHELFYAPDAKGVEIFLDLKARIQEEFQPDFLLIDSRTGISEMGGVATTIMADAVVCILLNNRENMEGTRAVLRSLRRSSQKKGDGGISFIIALSRVPELETSEQEQSIVEKIRRFLCQEAERLEDTLSLKEVFVLHSEPVLQLRESLRVGKGVSLDESILLRDYLRLFSQIVPTSMIEPRIKNLFEAAKGKIWNDPESATKEMEQLAEFYGRSEGYLELLRLYHLRNITDTRALKMAQSYWELTRDADDKAVGSIVTKSFKEFYDPQRSSSRRQVKLGFVESVWLGAAKKDVELGERLAASYANVRNIAKAVEIYLQLIDHTENGEIYAGRCLELMLIEPGMKANARRVIDRFKKSSNIDERFISAWAEFSLSERDTECLELLSGEPLISVLLKSNPGIALRICEATGKIQKI